MIKYYQIYNRTSQAYRYSVRWVMQSILLVLVASSNVHGGVFDETFCKLRTIPGDKATIAELGKSISANTNAPDRDAALAAFALALYGIGDLKNAAAAAKHLTAAYPGSKYKALLLPDHLLGNCIYCTSGKIYAPCKRCGGNGRCSICKGSGKRYVATIGGNREIQCTGCEHSNGRCSECLGTGKTTSTCNQCGGRGRSFSQTRARDSLDTVLSSNISMRASLTATNLSGNSGITSALAQSDNGTTPSESPNKPSDKPDKGGSTENALGSVGAMRLTQSVGKYTVPVVSPPVTEPVDAETRAMFDEQIKLRFADKVAKLEEYEKGGWSGIAALPKDKEQIIKEERHKLLSFDDDERWDVWRFVASEMEWKKRRRAEDAERAKREAAGRAERESMAQREAEAEQRRIAERDARQKAEQMKEAERRASETEQKEMTKIEMDSIVAEAMQRAADQVEKSEFLKSYWVTADEIVAAASGKQTSLERDQKKAELWSRAMPHPRDARIRALFVPFPSGLPYVVSDVALRDGAISLTLKGRESKPGSKDDRSLVQDTVPDGTLRAISHGLLSPHLPNRFEYVKLKVPADADEIASLKKGDAVNSGEWLMPVIINDSGVIRANLYFYRTKKELLKLWGQVE